MKIAALLMAACIGAALFPVSVRAEAVLLRARFKVMNSLPSDPYSDPGLPPGEMELGQDVRVRVHVLEPLIGYTKTRDFDAIIRLSGTIIDQEKMDVLLFTHESIDRPGDKYKRYLLWSFATAGFCITPEDAKDFGISDRVQSVQRDHRLECRADQ